MARSHRIHLVCALAASVTMSAAVSTPPGEAATKQPRASVHVIVQAATSELGREAVEAAGGHVSRELPIVAGVAADVPRAAMSQLRHTPGVRAVTADAEMTVQGTVAPGSPDVDPVSVYREVVRADDLAASGATGEGVTVALLDTGVADTPDLAGRVLDVTGPLGLPAECVNLSGEPTCADDYGHGTFMAGIIAGSGASSAGAYTGVAPDADLVSIKVAAADGSADVSNVLAGIQWAVSFRDLYDIRVLNLSLGTDSTTSWKKDPLNFAVEQAWDAGIVVVVAASNRGPASGTISKPGDDPYVITVGAVDDLYTVDIADDVLPDFSGRGPAPRNVAKPDVVAPGAHIVSLRAVGSTIDGVGTHIDGTYRQGSGTSMATAVVSGLAADIFSAKPTYNANRLKFTLTSTARPVADPSINNVGKGMVDGYAAAFTAPTGRANKGLADALPLLSLNSSRGTVDVVLDDNNATVLIGNQTAQLQTVDPTFYTGVWTETTWALSTWNLFPWYSTSWYGDNWEGDNWEGCSWNGVPDDTCSYGAETSGSAWYGAWD